MILLGSGRTYRLGAFAAAAERLGVDVVTGDDVPLPLMNRAAALDLPLDYRDLVRSTEAVVAFARRVPVAAIVGVDDSGTLLAARASQALGLPHNAPEAAEAARDKHLMRCRFAAAGVPSPAFRLWRLSDDPATIAAATRFPCVVKPTMLSGSRGVMRADDPAELAARFARLRGILAHERCDEVLVEDYIPGVEVALEGLLDGGRLRTLALFDKPDPLDGPYFEETLYVTPSRLPADVQAAIEAAAAAAAAALGLREGPIHAELRWNERGPFLIEVAARSIGGLCSQTLRFGTDMSLEELILRQALGLPDRRRARGPRRRRDDDPDPGRGAPARRGRRRSRVGGAGDREGRDHRADEPPAGAAARRRQLPGLHLRPRRDAGRGRSRAARGARVPALRDRARDEDGLCLALPANRSDASVGAQVSGPCLP